MPGTASDSDEHLDAVRRQLKAYLSTKSTGRFMYQETRESYPNPCIKIKDVGNVGLPLSLRDIDAVRQASHQAPFGKGAETVVDENVRKTWQINASDLVCSNPRWEKWVKDELLPKCCDALGVSPLTKRHVRAELYKMLLYEEGAHFQPHKDTEKAPGMFATLAICLPTEHQGGELVLSTTTNALPGAARSRLPSIFLLLREFTVYTLKITRYADVIHEVKPVTSRHRVVLTYNVINNDPSMHPPAAAALGDRDSQMQDALARWSEAGVWNDDNHKEVDFLCHYLQHEYTETSLSLARLAGADLQVVTRAVHAAKKTDFLVYLATFERKRVGGYDEDSYGATEIQDEIDDDWTLEKIVTLDGKEVEKDILISKYEMLDPKTLDRRDPDDEEYEG